jgi:hypothetical protein
MHQSKLPFKYEEEKKVSGLTGLAGLPLYAELLHALKIDNIMRKHLDSGTREDCLWKPSRIVMQLLLLNLAGGEHVDDLRILQTDSGFCTLWEKISTYSLGKSELRKQKHLMRAQGAKLVPSASTVFRFLKQDGLQGLELRGQGNAFIPAACATVKQLCNCNKGLLSALAENSPSDSITLDMDATLIETHKENSLYSYKGFSAYQPLNIWWDEQRVMLYTEFRDGNVPAGYSLRPALDKALSYLPESVRGKQIFLRSDTAAYNINLLKYCEDMGIQFAVGCKLNTDMRKAILDTPEYAWKKLDNIREYTEVCFVPNSLATTKKNKYEFLYLATRELLKQQLALPGTPEASYPFPTEKIRDKVYKIHTIVTNRSIDGDKVINWYYKRSGHSEEVHSILKSDLAGGVLPCNNFHANSVWWLITVIAHNIHSIFKKLCCGDSWLTSRLKRIRFHIICIPGRVVERGCQLYIRLNAGHPSYTLLQSIREAIWHLRPCHSF